MIYVLAILFPLIAIGCSAWIFIAMISYVADIQRSNRSGNK